MPGLFFNEVAGLRTPPVAASETSEKNPNVTFCCLHSLNISVASFLFGFENIFKSFCLLVSEIGVTFDNSIVPEFFKSLLTNRFNGITILYLFTSTKHTCVN